MKSATWRDVSRRCGTRAAGLAATIVAAVLSGADAVAVASPAQPPLQPTYLAADGPSFLRPETVCPEEFEPLTQMLLRDLPDYANRVLARARPAIPSADVQTHIAIASRATVVDAVPGPRWSAPSPEAMAANGVEQAFFTTLERQYVGDRLTSLQHYHWVLLANTAQGWRLVALFSRLGGYPAEQPPSPFQDATHGDIGRAIELWLRDCRAGAVGAAG